MRFSEEWNEEDNVKNEPDDKRCMREIRKMSNTIRSDIQMEEDVGINTGTRNYQS